MIVQAPCEDLSLFIDIERMMIPTEDIKSILRVHFLNSECLLVLVSSVQHPSYFAALWITPGVDGSFRSENQSVMGATLNFLYRGISLLGK